MSTSPAEFAEKASEAFAKLEALIPEMEAAKDTDTARYDALKAEVGELSTFVGEQKLAEATARRDAEFDAIKQQIADLQKEQRSPSKAALVSGGRDDIGEPDVDTFLRNLAIAQDRKSSTSAKAQAEGALEAMGSHWSDVPMASKATLGETNANGGFLAPRSVVAQFTQVANVTNPYRSLLTVVTGILGPTVEVPHIGLLPTRAAVVARGAQKPLQDLSLANYTATFYTLAQINDAANQWLRQTGGAGEKLIRARLASAMAAGEGYYILNGSGSSEPKGILTSLGTSGTFVTTFSSPATTTIAGNFATAISLATGDLAGRNRIPTGVVMNASDFYKLLPSGADAAGFYIAPGGATSINAIGQIGDGTPAMRVWGIPLYIDNNMPSDSLVVGDWKSAEMYLGEDIRIDTSTEAYDRWDKNLTGFRAEEDFAFNADPYVVSGLFQRITNVLP